MTGGSGFTAAALRMSGGVIVWGLHFFAVYGATALACARGSPQAAPVAVAAATAVAVALLVPMVLAGWRQRAAFEGCLQASLAAFALLAVVWEALPALWIAPC